MNKFWYENFEKFTPPAVVPAKQTVPKWYKDANAWYKGEVTGDFLKTFKMCVPYLDALLSGYSLILPCDVLVEYQGEHVPSKFSWKHKELPIMALRSPASTDGMPISNEFERSDFVWITPATFKLPKGYSLLFTHPFNRHDLPFTTLSGIIDLNFALNRGNIPFFLKKGFSGVIPQGTPIAQLLPFKREDWKAVEKEGLIKESELSAHKSRLIIRGWYKNLFWNKKSYD